MTGNLNIPFETLVELVEQLPVEQQQILIERLQERIPHNGQSVAEKLRKLRSIQVDVKVNQEPSPRREDWYDDDGR